MRMRAFLPFLLLGVTGWSAAKEAGPSALLKRSGALTERAGARPKAAGAVDDFVISAFEVQRHVQSVKGAKQCDVTLMAGVNFGNTQKAFTGPYKPPVACAQTWARIALYVSCEVELVQSNQFVDVYFDDLNILRAVTPQPLETGAIFNFDEDVTKYNKWLTKNRQVTVSIPGSEFEAGGAFNCNSSLTFWSGTTPSRYADVVVPVAPVNGKAGQFQLSDTSNTAKKQLAVLPKNIVRAQLEILATPTNGEEGYWFTTNPYREIIAYVDSIPVGTVTPFPVYYPSSLNALLWSPMVGIGCFGIPTYTMDVTPFVGLLVKGKPNTISFRIPGINYGGVWQVTGVLHLWLDPKAATTSGGVISNQILPTIEAPIPFYKSAAKDVIVGQNFTTRLQKTNRVTGYVVSSAGNNTVSMTASIDFFAFLRIVDSYSSATHSVLLQELGQLQQVISSSSQVKVTTKQGVITYSDDKAFNFPLQIVYDVRPYPDGVNYRLNSSISQAFNFNRTTKVGAVRETESLINRQDVTGIVDYLADDAWGASTQKYVYTSNFDAGCYTAEYSHVNYTFLQRKIVPRCEG